MKYIYQNHFQDRSGNVVTSGNVTVYNGNTTNLATIYSSSGSSVVTGSVVTTGTDGFFKFWVDANDYTAGSKFKIILSKTDFTSKTYDDIAILPETYAYYANPSAADQGVDNDDDSIKDLANAIGSSNYRIIILRPGTYTVSTDMTVTPNIILDAQPGVTISLGAGKTLTANLKAGWYPVFSGTGSFVHNGAEPIKVNWWVTSGTGTSADHWDIANFEEPIKAAGSYKEVVWTPGYYLVTSTTRIDIEAASGPDFIHLYSTGEGTCQIDATAAITSIFSFTDTTNYTHHITIDGFYFDGNTTAGTDALVDLRHTYLTKIINCTFTNSNGKGLQIKTVAADTSDGQTSIELYNNEYSANASHGLYVVSDSRTTAPSNINIAGQNTVENNAGWGIYIEKSSYITIHDYHFEYNELGDICVDNSDNVRIYNNYVTRGTGESGTYSFGIINGSYNCRIYDNLYGKVTNIYANDYGLYLDNTTYENYYWSNSDFRGTSQSDLGTSASFGVLKILDRGRNHSLNPNSNIVRMAENSPAHNENRYSVLNGDTFFGNQKLINYILSGEKISSTAAGNWSVTANSSAKAVASQVLPTGLTGNAWSYQTSAYTTQWLWQDVSTTAQAGETMTFSIFIRAGTTGGTATVGAAELYLGNSSGASGANPASSQHFARLLVDSKFISNAGFAGNNPFIRQYITWTATQKMETIRCRIRPVQNSATIVLWGAQLNKGGLAPYISNNSTLNTVTVYPGWRCNRIMAKHGANLGVYDNSSVGKAIGSCALTINYFSGKYQKIIRRGHLDISFATPSEAGEELQLTVEQTGSSGTINFLTTSIIKGSSVISSSTQANKRFDILNFHWNGTYWIENDRRKGLTT